MSPKIPATRLCAAPCKRIDFVASPRCAVLWAGWVLAVCAVVAFAVAAPWPARLILCVVLVAANVRAILPCVLLRGERAVPALEWQEQGGFTALLGESRSRHPAELASGSFRFGGLLLLRLRTPAGMRAVLIDGERQSISHFRRLCRQLNGVRTARSGRSREPADTIRPKV
jgi:hypothetical protein